MNFDPYESHWREHVPPMTLLEMCWQLRSPRGRVLTCAVYRTLADLREVRCGYGESDLIRSHHAVEIGTARALAADWKSAAALKGFTNAIE